MNVSKDSPAHKEFLAKVKELGGWIEDDKVRFQQWASGGAHVTLSHVFSFTMHPNRNRYLEGTTELCWRAWQAALTHRATTATCPACNGTHCIPGPVGDPSSECEACFDQQPDTATTAADGSFDGHLTGAPSAVKKAADQQGDMASASTLPSEYTYLSLQANSFDDWDKHIFEVSGGAQSITDLHFRIGDQEWKGSLRELMAAQQGAAQAQADVMVGSGYRGGPASAATAAEWIMIAHSINDRTGETGVKPAIQGDIDQDAVHLNDDGVRQMGDALAAGIAASIEGEHEAFKAAMVAANYPEHMFDGFLAEGEWVYHNAVANQMFDAWQVGRK